MLDPKDLDHLNRQTAALADYLARKLKRAESESGASAPLTSVVEMFRAQLRYRRSVDRRLNSAGQVDRSQRRKRS